VNLGPRLKKNRNLLSLCFGLGCVFAGAGACQQFVVPQLTLERGFSPQQAALVLGTLYLVMPVSRLFSSYTLRGLGVWLGLMVGGLGYAQFPLVMGLGPSFGWLAASAGFWGFTAAVFWVASGAEVLRISSEANRGWASGVFMASAFFGQAVGVLLLGELLAKAGATVMFGTAGAVTLLGLLVLATLPFDLGTYARPSVIEALKMLRRPNFALAAFFLAVNSLGIGAVYSLLAGASGEKYGLGAVSGAALAYYVARVIFAPFAGRLSDKIGRTRVMALAFLLGAAGLAFGAMTLSLKSFVVTAFSLGLAAAVVPICALALAGDEAKGEKRHLALSSLFAVSDLAVAFSIIGGQYLRKLTASSSYALPFGALAVVMAVAAIGALVLSRAVQPSIRSS